MAATEGDTADVLVTADRLHHELTAADPPILLDLRPAEAFSTGHIPGAVHIDLWGLSLIDTDPAPLRAFVWAVRHLFELRGVSASARVVVYDEQSGIRAARAFWFLEYFDHPDVRVLDGGIGAWVRSGHATTSAATVPEPVQWPESFAPSRLATWREVRERIGRSDVVMLDTRTDEEYYGTLVRAARGGAIPGAIHIEWTRNLDPDGAFKPRAALRTMYEQAGITPDREVVTYCQGGYRGAHAYLTLRVLGYPRVRNYLGSWKEWGDRTELPIEVPRKQ